MCSIDDLELVMKDIQESYTVDDDGDAIDPIETFMMEATAAYYDCRECGEDWTINAVQSKEQAFKLAQEHCNE